MNRCFWLEISKRERGLLDLCVIKASVVHIVILWQVAMACKVVVLKHCFGGWSEEAIL